MDIPSNPMHCHRFQCLLDEALAGRAAAADTRFLTEHRAECAACADSWERRAALLRFLGSSRLAPRNAPRELDARAARASDPEEFVRLLVRHLPAIEAPQALDELVLDPIRPFASPARPHPSPALSIRELLASPAVLLGSPALRLAAGLLVTAGAAYVASQLFVRHAPVIPAHQITKVSADEVPPAFRSTLEFLAGGLPGSRKG